MNIVYRILQVEDDIEFINTTKRNLEDRMKKIYMLPTVDQYEDYNDFIDNYIAKVDNKDFVEHDLILVDYTLDDDEKNATGMNVIDEIRKKEIYTDIIFYSSNYEKMREAIKKRLSDDRFIGGIYFCDKEILIPKVMNVINKNLKLSSNIRNIRGLIVDTTSKFDIIIKETIKLLYVNLKEDEKKRIINILDESLARAEEKIMKNFNKIKGNLDDKERLIGALESVEYVMNTADKYKVFDRIIKCVTEESISFSYEDYKENIIKVRNKIAHQYIYICEEYKRLIVTNKINYKCDKGCDSCIIEYDKKFINKMKELLYHYYLFFNNVKSKYLDENHS